MRLGTRLATGIIAGVLVGAFGTAMHRTMLNWGWLTRGGAAGGAGLTLPAGLVIALALTASAGLFLRAALGFTAFASYAVSWIVVVQLFALPGGSVLITSPHAAVPIPAAGVIWSYAGVVVLLACALLPARWFRPAVEGATDE